MLLSVNIYGSLQTRDIPNDVVGACPTKRFINTNILKKFLIANGTVMIYFTIFSINCWSWSAQDSTILDRNLFLIYIPVL